MNWVLRVSEAFKVIGSAASVVNLFILMGFTVFLFVITSTDDADIFPSPMVYLDAHTNIRGNLFYEPINGDEVTDEAGEPKGKAFCLGDEVLWIKNVRYSRSTRIQRSYYLQIERPYRFDGAQAGQLTERYGTELLTTRALHSSITPSTHVIEGFFDGGVQSYTLPPAEELREHDGIKPGDNLRIYVDVEAPFSQATGYYVPVQIAENCEPVPPTVRQGRNQTQER